MSDVERAHRAAAGDMAAFAEVYSRYYPLAMVTARHFTRSHSIAEDAVHEMFLWLCEGRWRLDAAIVPADGRLDGFVRTLAKYATFKTIYRVNALARRAVENGDDGHSTVARLHATTPDPEAVLIRRELSDQIWKALTALPPQLLRVAYLRYIEELCAADIAERVGVDARTIPGYLHTIRRKLRAALAGYVSLSSTRPTRSGHRRFARRLPEPAHA